MCEVNHLFMEDFDIFLLHLMMFNCIYILLCFLSIYILENFNFGMNVQDELCS